MGKWLYYFMLAYRRFGWGVVVGEGCQLGGWFGTHVCVYGGRDPEGAVLVVGVCGLLSFFVLGVAVFEGHFSPPCQDFVWFAAIMVVVAVQGPPPLVGLCKCVRKMNDTLYFMLQKYM